MLILISGIPASGKSHITKIIQEKFDIPIIESDKIREEFMEIIGFSEYGHIVEAPVSDRYAGGIEKTIWKNIYGKILHTGLNNNHLIFDATNLRISYMKQVIKLVPQHDVFVIFLDVPVDVVLERNSKRDNPVPDHVIHSMAQSFEWLVSDLSKFPHNHLVVKHPVDVDNLLIHLYKYL